MTANPITARNPNSIDRRVLSTAPHTEAKPLTAHPHATYSREVGQSPDGTEAERHEHAEAKAQRREHHEGDGDAQEEAQVEQRVGECRSPTS